MNRLLVIDDEPSVADALQLILEAQGYAVVVASNGRDGIEQARRAEFLVTITDLRLPDMNGLEIIDALRKGGMGGDLILITSHGGPELFARARDLGAAGFIGKPFLPSEILQLVAALLEKRETCAS